MRRLRRDTAAEKPRRARSGRVREGSARPARRRRGGLACLPGLLVLLLAAPTASAKRVVVLGFDGMDPDVVRGLMEQGQLPTFTRLAKEGTIQDLGTSIPPLG